MSDFQAILLRLLPEGLRRLLRYLIGGLVSVGVLTVMQGEAISADPQVQLAITAAAGVIASWLVEKTANAAKRWGLRDNAP